MRKGVMGMNIITEQENSMYSLLTAESRKTVDRFIAFLFETQKSEFNEETIQTLKDCREGKNMVGPFENVEDLMRSLHA